MFGKLTPEEILELREEARRAHELNEARKRKHVAHVLYQPPQVTMRETYRPKGMISAFIKQCKPVDCFPTPKKKGKK